jgi:hypothetical protein
LCHGHSNQPRFIHHAETKFTSAAASRDFGSRSARLPSRSARPDRGPGSDLELLFAIAQRPRSLPAEELAEQLWPARDWHDARNSLKVQLHRLRRRLADDGAIVRNADGLRLCSDARVDLWEIERSMSALRAGEINDDAERAVLFGVYQRLRLPRPACLTSWDWFEPVSRRLSDTASDLGRRLLRTRSRTGERERRFSWRQKCSPTTNATKSREKLPYWRTSLEAIVPLRCANIAPIAMSSRQNSRANRRARSSS